MAALPGPARPTMICMRASDLPAVAPRTASQHPISLSSIRPATCSSIERSEVPRCPPNGPTIDGRMGSPVRFRRGAPQGDDQRKRWSSWRSGAAGRGRPVVFSLPVGGWGCADEEHFPCLKVLVTEEPAPALRCSWRSFSARAMNLIFRRIRAVVGAADIGRPARSKSSGREELDRGC
jgi:hypothetical protein